MHEKRMSKVERSLDHLLLQGDALDVLDTIKDRSCQLVISSPPYNIGKEYERDRKRTLKEYTEWLAPIVKKACAKVKKNGHLCWQVGNFIDGGEVFPLDYIFYEMIKSEGFKLRNRIIWQFNFGLHANRRFSGRYETVLWFTRSDDYYFHLDPVRVRQLYPGKRHSNKRGDKAGRPSGNPKGKNPSDYWTFNPETAFFGEAVWSLPNVKSRHPEKTIHPCQFPSELVERCVLAMTRRGDTVLDPFVGTGTAVIAAAMHERRGIGIDQSERYIAIAKARLEELAKGTLVTRPFGKPVRTPKVGERVASLPEEWCDAAE